MCIRDSVRVARAHEKVANRRKDALHKFTTHAVGESQNIAVEDLNVRGMQRNRRLAKAVGDAAMSELARQLEYKCAWSGRGFVRVGRFYPSSKTCSACGYVYRGLTLAERVWDCPACGMRCLLYTSKRRKRMGLFDMLKKKAEPAAAAAPASISASAGADVLCSPVKGKVIKMADVPDPVFGGEVLGKGCAVWPEDDLVYAPCDGKVTVTMGHAVGLQSDSGIEVLVLSLIHI